MDRISCGQGPTACHPCAKAKVRCEPLKGGGRCKRCLRLKKECTAQAPGAHKREKTKMPEISRIEQKLDAVAALLAASDTQSRYSPRTTESPLFEISERSSNPRLDESFYADEQEAQLVLNIYREKLAPHFPFIVVPPNVTPQELRQTKPFLYRVIMALACQRSSSHQQILSDSVRNVYINSVLVSGEKNLDLLQGLLVFLGWFHIHFQFRSQLSNPAYLLMAMVMDLGLHRPYDMQTTTGLPLHYLRAYYNEPQLPRQRTLEERRTYVGCYHLLTTISLCNREMSVLRYTKYTEECSVILSEMKEYPTDEYIVHLLRLHRIGEKIRKTLWDDPIDVTWGLSSSLGMCVRYLEIELRHFKDSIPLNLAQNTLLQTYVNTLEISLYSIALCDKFGDEEYGEYQLTRFKILHSSLIATKALLDQLSDLPLEVRICTPYTCWSQFIQAVVVLSRLSLLEGEVWKEIYDQHANDFSQEIDIISEKFNGLQAWNQAVDSRHFIPEAYLRIKPRLKLMKETHEKIKAAQAERARDLTDPNFSLDLEDLLLMPTLDLLDGELWQQV